MPAKTIRNETRNGMRVPRAITRDLQTRIEAVISPNG